MEGSVVTFLVSVFVCEDVVISSCVVRCDDVRRRVVPTVVVRRHHYRSSGDTY